MTDNRVIDIGELIDNQPLRPFHIRLILLLFLVLLSDGYDVQSIGFAAPGIVKTLGADRAMLGPVFSASLVGILIGAPLFGWIGDRFGRRVALLGGVLIYGIVTLAAAAANSLPELLVARFLTGIGLGGVPANAVALVAEYAPKRIRATMIVSAQLGLTFGSMLPALASGLLEADYGWRSLFVVGGIAPIAISILIFFTLPESLKYMVVSQKPSSKLRRIAGALDPRLRSESGLSFVIRESAIVNAERFHIKQLFADGLTWITPLIWALYVTFLTANYFLHGWMPILFRGEGLTIRETAVATAMFDVGGVVGALTASRLVDRFGVAAITGLYIVACPAVATIGIIGNSVYLLSAAIFLAGFCLIGITLSMGAVTGMVYPTEIRAKGYGWAYGIGRFSSMLSPVVGGWLIAMNLPISQLFLAPVVPIAVGAVLCIALTRASAKRAEGRTVQGRAVTT